MVPKGMTAPPSRRQRLVAKRRKVFLRLLVAAAVTFFIGIIPALRSVWVAHVALDVALVGYVIQLRRWHAQETQRRRVLRQLPTAASAEPEESVSVVEDDLTDDTWHATGG